MFWYDKIFKGNITIRLNIKISFYNTVKYFYKVSTRLCLNSILSSNYSCYELSPFIGMIFFISTMHYIYIVI